MDTAPRTYARKPFCPPAIISLASENFLRSHPQVWSITLLLPRRISPRLGCKFKHYFRKNKEKGENLSIPTLLYYKEGAISAP